MDAEPQPEGPLELLRHVLDLAALELADPGESGTSAALQRICRAAVAELGLAGAAIHVRPGPDRDIVAAASSVTARTTAEIAFAVGEGPSHDAFATRRPVLVSDLAARLHRWPGYVSQALELGVLGVHAFPLQLGATCFGVLDLYLDRSDVLGQQNLSLAATFAHAAVLVLLDAVHIDGLPDEGVADGLHRLQDGLGDAFDHHAEVYQAQGMVMVDLGLPLGDALVRMRARAFGTETSLVELSRRIVAGVEVPNTWDSDPDNKHPGSEDPGLESGAGG